MTVLEIMELLGFQQDDIFRQRDNEAAFGQAYMNVEDSGRDEQLIHLAAATSFRSAGAHSLLLNENKAASLYFQKSCAAYFRISSPYGFLLQWLANDEGDLAPKRSYSITPKSADDVFLLWKRHPSSRLGNLIVDTEYLPALRANLDLYRTEPVGPLELPAALYLELFDAVYQGQETQSLQAVKEALFPFLAVFATAVKEASEDTYHWRRLMTQFHPAEPDILAIIIAVSSVFKNHDTTVENFITTLPIAEQCKQLLTGTLNQLTYNTSHYRSL